MKKELLILGIFILLAFVFWGSVTLSEEYTASVSVPFKIIIKERKISAEGDIPENLNVRLRTTGWELLKLKYIQNPAFELVINQISDYLIFQTSAISNEQLGLSSSAKVLDIKPDIIRINFDISAERKVKIYPKLIYSLKDGYDLVSPPKVEPESITIKGSKKIIAKIDSLPTETIELEELSEFLRVQTKIKDTLKNLIDYEKIPVNITLDIQQIVDKDFEKIPIELVNVPANKEIILYPSYLDLKVRGGITVLGLLKQDSIKVFVDYKKYSSPAEQDIIPEFILPSGVKIIDYSPKQFKLIIRK